MKYLITGGSGFLGGHLIRSLINAGHEVINLSRRPRSSSQTGLTHLVWDGRSIPEKAGQVDGLINLAGAGIADKRWTDARKRILIESRVRSTRACVDFINRQAVKPSVFLSASGYNYYGALYTGVKKEGDPAGKGFLAEICIDWEKAAEGAECRTVLLRTSVVLGMEGGPLPKLLTPYKMFVGGPVGTGKQGFPWIHVEDWVGAALHALENEKVSGPLNMVAPQEINAKQFSDALAKVLKRPNFFRLPKGVLNLIFGEMSVVLWGGGLVKPSVLEAHQYSFQHTDVEAALRDLLKV